MFDGSIVMDKMRAMDLTNNYFCNNLRAGVTDDVACRTDEVNQLIYNVTSLESGGFNCSSVSPQGVLPLRCDTSLPGDVRVDCGVPGDSRLSSPCAAGRSTPADGTISGNVVVISSPMTTFSQPTVVTGDVVIASGAGVAFGAGGSLTVTGSLAIQPGATISFVANVSGTFVLLQGQSLTGTVSALTALAPPGCVATTGPPIYTSMTLSVAVTVDCGSGGGLSTGAIVGIVVGAVVGGILVALLIVVIVRMSTQRYTTRAQKEILHQNQFALKQQYS
jgi:hypothetical protein